MRSEVDIIGEDGRLYRGRLDLRSPDSKLPTIAPKDGESGWGGASSESRRGI